MDCTFDSTIVKNIAFKLPQNSFKTIHNQTASMKKAVKKLQEVTSGGLL